MDNCRVNRIAETVTGDHYPRTELLKTLQVFPDKIDTEIKVWVVDGQYIRTYIDEEFTNFGQHYRFPFIPEFEFWLDREDINNESAFFIEHLLVEWSLMRDGKEYDEAIEAADLAERELRRKSVDMSRVMDPVRKVVDYKLFRDKLLKSLSNGVNVWLVHGELIRSVLNIDFTQGGHELVYEYVPPGDVWIDNDLEWQERAFVVLHELNELKKMKEGWTYEKAHENSSALESHCRHHIDELHDALISVGWA